MAIQTSSQHPPLDELLPTPTEIVSKGIWQRIYVGQIRAPNGQYRECWVSPYLSKGVMHKRSGETLFHTQAIYHQPEGGFRCDDMDEDWQDNIIESSQPLSLLAYGEDLQESVDLLAASTDWQYDDDPTGMLIFQYRRVKETETRSSAIRLPACYRHYNREDRSDFPKWNNNDEEFDEHEKITEQQFFGFKDYQMWSWREDLQIMAEILQTRFDTPEEPPLGLVENLWHFGKWDPYGDPRKVFKFFEWVEWLRSVGYQGFKRDSE